jgi:early secretory antigenic target protein ESAT-6
MGDGNIKVDFGAVSQAAGDIHTQSNQIEQELSDLRSQIANLESIWQGSASENFQHTKSQWLQAAQDLQQTLAAIGAAVSSTGENYQGVERQNAGRFGGG